MFRPPARVRRCSPSPDSAASCQGFTLLELAVVVAIISIVLAVCVPLARQLIIQARAAALENDLRVFTAALQSYANEHGDWPAGDGTPGAFPAGMGAYLSETNWQRRTPIGGNYAWDPNSLQQGSRHRAVIVIASTPDNPVTSDRVQLLEIDQKFDDGELTTGSLVLGYRNYPAYILEH
jgi:prepilin-type N-terminal cleavage/methylation domain-containing protein